MERFTTETLQATANAIAPDGSEVRILLATARCSLAHFRLAPGMVSKAVAHRTVEEIWYLLGGRGRMWRKLGAQEEVVEISVGVAITIPVGTRFQFRSEGNEPLAAVGVTIPPWPGMEEADDVAGPWEPTV
ncbi:MAG: cupin domain-containing protein [Kiloniellales bacterium]